MGMYQNFKDISNVIYFDEDLLRLLYYSPANLANNTPDPLDASLPNISDMAIDQQWDIRNKRIYFSTKTDDLPPDESFARIYVYPGRRRADGNYLMADQELRIGIFCCYDWENGDLRSTRISDRLNQLFISERITGIGKVNYKQGYPMNAPSGYIAFEHVYEFGGLRK